MQRPFGEKQGMARQRGGAETQRRWTKQGAAVCRHWNAAAL